MSFICSRDSSGMDSGGRQWLGGTPDQAGGTLPVPGWCRCGQRRERCPSPSVVASSLTPGQRGSHCPFEQMYQNRHRWGDFTTAKDVYRLLLDIGNMPWATWYQWHLTHSQKCSSDRHLAVQRSLTNNPTLILQALSHNTDLKHNM